MIIKKSENLRVGNDINDGGGGTGTGWTGEVANFAALPAATGSGDIYLVLATTGFLWNRRKGLYRDEGVGTWNRLSNATFEVLDTEATFSDDGDDTKKMDFELSGITAGNTRTLTVPDASGTIALLEVNNIFTGTSQVITPTANGSTFRVNRSSGDPALIVNTDTENIGIGNNPTPQWALHVHKNTVSENYIHVSNAQTTSGAFRGASFGVGSSETLDIINRENTDLDLYTNKLKRVTIGAAGGLNLITGAFQLNGTSINTGGTLNNVAYLDQANIFSAVQKITVPNATSVLTLKRDQSSVSSSDIVARIEAETTDTTDPGVCASIAALSYGSSCETGWRFQVGVPSALIEAMQIDPNGYFGIGTPWPDSPDTLLHLQHATEPYLRFTRNDTTVTADEIIGKIEFETKDSGSAGVAAYIQAIAEGTAGEVGLALATGTGGSAVEAIRIDKSRNIGMSTTSPLSSLGGLDIASGGLSLILGADQTTQTTRTDSTPKYCRIGVPHYTNAEEPVCLISAGSGIMTGTKNFIHIGGGTSLLNSVNEFRVYTSNAIDTTTGTLRMEIDSAGARTYSYRVIKQVFSVSGIEDNTATTIFTITTPLTGTQIDGAGSYSCYIRGLVTYPMSGSPQTNKPYHCIFSRSNANASGNPGTSSAVQVLLDGAAVTTGVARSIDSMTISLVETDEQNLAVQVTIDLTTASTTTSYFIGEIEIIWNGYDEAPSITVS